MVYPYKILLTSFLHKSLNDSLPNVSSLFMLLLCNSFMLSIKLLCVFWLVWCKVFLDRSLLKLSKISLVILILFLDELLLSLLMLSCLKVALSVEASITLVLFCIILDSLKFLNEVLSSFFFLYKVERELYFSRVCLLNSCCSFEFSS